MSFAPSLLSFSFQSPHPKAPTTPHLTTQLTYGLVSLYSAGGGGSNSEHRKAKIVAKNQKLNEERHRQAKDVKKDKNRHDKGKPGRSDATASDANAVVVDAENDRFAGMHPSRRGRI